MAEAEKMNKAACFTDIHWGRKNNSELHNQDCLRFVEWFCGEVKKDTDIDLLTHLFIATLEGAIMMSKLERNNLALKKCISYLRTIVAGITVK